MAQRCAIKKTDLLPLILSLEKRNLEPGRAEKLGTARKQRPQGYNNRAVQSANNQSEQGKAFSPGAPWGRNLAVTLTSPSEVCI